jgi:hypothetical protein
MTTSTVIPANAGIQETKAEVFYKPLNNPQPHIHAPSQHQAAVVTWIPACAGMTAGGIS